MNEIARLPAEERRLYFEQAAARMGKLTPQLVEKDFWVCWVLRQAFTLDPLGEHLTFKGGTSLSKAYQVIERFSEDVDLAIERSYLGFGDANEPERGASGKERKRRVKALREKCQRTIREELHPALQAAVASALPENDWRIELADDDPDGQSLRFFYPPSVIGAFNRYFAPSVKLELGARSDHFPVESRTIRPYLADALPAAVHEPETRVRVLHAERTFWEKATILHAIAHRPIDKPLPNAQSRHYYDLHQLANHTLGRSAVGKLELLARVAVHKSLYFESAQARYDEARPGSLRLVPPDDRVRELRGDYASMAPMFFGSAPPFDQIIDRLQLLETEINSTRQAAATESD